MGRRGRTILLVATVSLLLTACGSATPQSQQHTHRTTQGVHRVEVTGGTTPQNALLQQLVNDVDPWAISAAAITPSPPEFPVTTDWVHLTIPFSQNDADVARRTKAEWDTMLTAGRYRDSAAANGWAVPDGYTVTYVSAAVNQGNASSPRFGGPPSHSISSPPESSIVANVQAGAAKLGLSSVNVSFLHINGLAVVVTATETPDALKKSVEAGELTAGALLGDLSQYEGVYIQIDDPADGSTLLVFGSATRADEGVSWTRPDLGLGGGASP